MQMQDYATETSRYLTNFLPDVDNALSNRVLSNNNHVLNSPVRLDVFIYLDKDDVKDLWR